MFIAAGVCALVAVATLISASQSRKHNVDAPWTYMYPIIFAPAAGGAVAFLVVGIVLAVNE